MGNYKHADELYHYGVKGMKWGVRRKITKLAKKAGRSAATAKRQLEIADDLGKFLRARAAEERHESDLYRRSKSKQAEADKLLEISKQFDAHADRVYNFSKSSSDFWTRRSDVAKTKVYDLVNKHRITIGKSEVDKLIKTYGETPYKSQVENYRNHLWNNTYFPDHGALVRR